MGLRLVGLVVTRSNTQTTALSLEGLTLGYERHEALVQVDLLIRKGDLVAVIGPNGAGKSTLLKGIAGLLKPLQGHVRYGGLSRTEIAYLPQLSGIDRSFPIDVFDFVSLGLWRQVGAFGRVGLREAEKINHALHTVGMCGLEKRPIGTLSGGQMQRALFARLLLQDASLLLLDEPFAAIDTSTVRDLMIIIRQWHTESRTVLTVLHDLDQVQCHFPRTVLLGGETIADGPTETVVTATNFELARRRLEAMSSGTRQIGHAA